MGTFGEKLQREREMRGISLEEIAEATKIGTRSLRALEEQDFDKLPGGIFNKGFVRAYSRYLGIDEEQAVADYVSALNEAQAAGKLSRAEMSSPPVEPQEPPPAPVRIPWTLLIIGALLVAVAFAARSYYAKNGWLKLRRAPASAQQTQVAPPVQGPAPSAATPVEASATPVSSPAGAPVPAPANAEAAAADALTVKIHAKELAWVWVQADGKLVTSENLAPNMDRVVQAKSEIVIKTGNAGGIELTKNDKPLPPLGPKNEVRTVTLTAQGAPQIE